MNAPTDETEYLKIDEAARLMGVSRRTIYRRIWSGELPASKFGGLYFIRKEDLQAQLVQGRPSAAQEGLESALSPLKCGYCYRLISSDAQVGEPCQETGCSQLICSQCLSEGIRHCAAHSPTRQQKWEQAQVSLQKGELRLVVKDITARLREINYLNRLQARLSRINTLIHPTSGEAILVADWEAVVERSDERVEVMRLLDKVMVDSETLSKTPLNARLHYRLPPQRNQKGLPLEIMVRVVSRLPVMLRDGFDTNPLGAEELIPWLARFSEEVLSARVFRMIVLASTTGWDASARAVVSGDAEKAGGLAFAHSQLVIYLFDLETSELLFNRRDDRARRYVELFAPLLHSEELEEALTAIEKQLLSYESLSLAYAVEVLPYARPVLEQAFDRMAASGKYALMEVEGLGKSIVRK